MNKLNIYRTHGSLHLTSWTCSKLIRCLNQCLLLYMLGNTQGKGGES